MAFTMALQSHNIIYKCKFIFVHKYEKNDFNYETHIFSAQFHVNIAVITSFVSYSSEKAVHFTPGN